MSIYYPPGPMSGSGIDAQEHEAYLPEVLNPLDVESPDSETIAAEIVGTYLANAHADRGTSELQWYACQVSIHPWEISRETFDQLTDELPPEFPWFESELSYEVWTAGVTFALTKKEDDSCTASQ